MKIYLAAPTLRQELMRSWRDDLTQRGHVVTSRWLDADLTMHPEWRRDALRSVEDVIAAKVVITCNLYPTEGKGGAHAEFGMAFAWGRRLVLIGRPTHVFHVLPNVSTYPDWPTFVAECPWMRGDGNASD